MAQDRRLGFIITAKDQATAALAKLRDSIKRLGDEGKKTEKKLKDVDKAADGIGTIGGAVDRLVGALAGLDFADRIIEQVKAARDFADSLNDMSERTGIAVERLSELAYAGQLSDVSIGAMKTGLKGLSKNMADAASGGKQAQAAFSAIGVSTDGRGTDEVLMDIAEAFSGYEDGANKSALAMALFGKAGVDMIPLLNQGKIGIKEMTDEARKLNATVDKETSAAAAEFNDNMDKLSAALRGTFMSAIGDSRSGIGGLIDDLVRATKETGGLVDGMMALARFRIGSPGKSNEDLLADLDEREKRARAGMMSPAFMQSNTAKALGYAQGILPQAAITKSALEKLSGMASGSDAAKKITDGVWKAREAVGISRADALSSELAQIEQDRKILKSIIDAKKAKPQEPETPKKDAPVVVVAETPEEAAARKRAEAAAAKAAAAEASAMERAKANFAKAQAESAANANIAALRRQEAVAKQLLDDGKISYAAYYASQVSLQQAAIDARLDALRREMDEQEKLSRSSNAKEADRIKARAELLKLDGEILSLQREREATAPDAARLQAKAEDELADKLRDVQLRTAELLGMASPEQRRAAIDGQYQDLRARAVSNYGEGSDAVNTVDKARTTEAAKAIFDDLMDNVSRSKSRADGARQRVDVMENAGLIGTREAELRRMAIDQELMRNTAAYIPMLQKQADLLGGDAVTAIEALETQVLELREAVDPQIQKLADAAGSAVTGVLDGLRDGSLKSASDVAKFFLKTLEDSIIREGTQELSKIVSGLFKDLFNSVASSMGGGGGMDLGGLASGAGGFLDSLIGSFVGFSSGGYTGGAGVSAPAGVVHGQEYVMSAPAVRTLGVGFLDALHSSARRGAPRVSLPGYANGGYVQSGSRGGSSGVTVVQNIQTPDAESFRRSQGQVEARTGIAVQRAIRKFK